MVEVGLVMTLAGPSMYSTETQVLHFCADPDGGTVGCARKVTARIAQARRETS